MSSSIDEIHFSLLRYGEEDLQRIVSRPPLVSSLQSFETSLCLVAAGRYPSALAVCTTAIESAWKAKNSLGVDDSVSLSIVLGGMNSELSASFTPPKGGLTALRQKRNHITHFGYSRRDDEESLRLLLSVGYPVLDHWLKESLSVVLIGSLVEDLGEKLQLAMSIAPRPSDPAPPITALDAIRGVRRWINYHTRFSYLAEWEQSVLIKEEESGWHGFEMRGKRLETLKNRYNCCQVIQCPICGGVDSLALELNDEALEANRLEADEGTCVNCEFHVPKSGKTLLNRNRPVRTVLVGSAEMRHAV